MCCQYYYLLCMRVAGWHLNWLADDDDYAICIEKYYYGKKQ